MVADLRGHAAFGASETPSRAAFNALSLSINDTVPTANATTRAQLVTDLTAAGYGPTASRPLTVHQADQSVEVATKVTRDGTNWKTIVAGSITAHAKLVAAAGIGNAVITNLAWAASPSTTGGMGVASNTYFTVPVTGRYLVSFGLSWDVNGTGYRDAWVLHGSTRRIEAAAPGSGIVSTYLSASRVVDCVAADQLSVQVYQTSGGNLNIQGEAAGSSTTFFTIDFLGD